jgi:hypothetical protein
VLIGIGSALVAFGAFLAVTVAFKPPKDAEVVGTAEHCRQQRNATVATTFAAGTGFGGAILLLSAAWPWAFVTLLAVAAVYVSSLAAATCWDQRLWLNQIRFERQADHDEQGRPGRVSLYTAAAFKLAPDDPALGSLRSHFYGAAGDQGALNIADSVQTTAERRAQFRWALRHPFGTESSRPLRRTVRDWLIVAGFRVTRARNVLGPQSPPE